MVDDRLLRRDVTLDDIMQEHARLVGSRSPSPCIPRRAPRRYPPVSPRRRPPPAPALPTTGGPTVPRSSAEAKALAAYYDVFGRELERKKYRRSEPVKHRPTSPTPRSVPTSSSSTADSDEFRRSKVFVPAFAGVGDTEELSVLGTATGNPRRLPQSDQVLVISSDDD